MKYVMLLFCSLFLTEIYGHTKVLKCTYFYSKEDFVKNRNGITTDFVIKAFYDKKFESYQTYDYKVEWLNNDSSQKTLNKSIYAIVTPEDTLINLKYFDKSGYQKLIVRDSFWIVFIDLHDPSTLLGTGVLFGVVGAAIMSSTNPVVPILFSPHSDKRLELTKKEVLRHLKSLKNQEAAENFKKEKKYDLEVLMTYFKYYIDMKYKYGLTK